MMTRSTIYEKIEDLLGLEVMASELMKKTLVCPEAGKYMNVLTQIMGDELRHIELVKTLLRRMTAQ